MEHNKQMILRTEKKYINGSVHLHVRKRQGIITAVKDGFWVVGGYP